MANQIDALRLAEMLCARLCHDLSGPIGSVNQALELAAAGDREMLALARQSAAELAQRLRWRRAAWGGDVVALDIADLRAMVAGPRFELDLTGVPPSTTFAPEMARVLLNVLLMASECFPKKGRIALSGTRTDVFIAIEGPNARWPATLSRCVGEPDVPLDDPRSLQVSLSVLIARGLGVRLSMLLGSSPGVPPLRLSAG